MSVSSFTPASFVQNFEGITGKATYNGRVSNANLNKLNKALVKANNSLHALTASQFETLQTDSNKLGTLIKGQESRQETKKLNKNTVTLNTICQSLTPEVWEKVKNNRALLGHRKLTKAIKTVTRLIPMLKERVNIRKKEVDYYLKQIPEEATRKVAISLIDKGQSWYFNEYSAMTRSYFPNELIIVEDHKGKHRVSTAPRSKAAWISLGQATSNFVYVSDNLRQAEEFNKKSQDESFYKFSLNNNGEVQFSREQQDLLKFANELNRRY